MNYLHKINNYLPNRNTWFGWSVLVITVLIAFTWQINTPMHSDDFLYKKMLFDDNDLPIDRPELGSEINSFKDVPKAIVQHMIIENGRLANLSYIAVQPLPLIIIKYICAIFLCLFILSIYVWCHKYCLKNDLISILLPLLFWTGLSWNEQMQSSDFQFNYVIPSFFMMVCLINFFLKNNYRNIVTWIILVLLSFWHEGFTLVLGSFFFIQFLLKKNKYIFLSVIILFIGFLFQFFHGNQTRMERVLITDLMSFYPWTRVIFTSWMSILAFLLWIFFRKKIENSKRQKIDNFGYGFVFSWVVMLILIFLVHPAQRAHWPNDLLALALILMIIQSFQPFRFSKWIKISAIILYCVWGTDLIRWQCQVTKFTNYCYNEIKNGNLIFQDNFNIINKYIPFWLNDITKLQYGSFNSFEHFVLAYVGTDMRNKTYLVLPHGCKVNSYKDFPKVPGNNDLYQVSNGVFIRHHDNKDLSHELSVTFGKPTLNANPLYIFLSLIKHGKINEITDKLVLESRKSLLFGNDSIEVVSFVPLPYSVKSRDVIKVDY